MTESPKVDDHFAGKAPAVRALYDSFVAAVRKIGPVQESAKKTSIHIDRSTALAGVRVRGGYLLLTIKSDRSIESSRIYKSEQTSKSRYHHEIKLGSPDEIDAELLGWLKEAYALSA